MRIDNHAYYGRPVTTRDILLGHAGRWARFDEVAGSGRGVLSARPRIPDGG
jgi:hypothetical protein